MQHVNLQKITDKISNKVNANEKKIVENRPQTTFFKQPQSSLT